MEQRIVDLTLPLRRGMHGVEWQAAKTYEVDRINTTNLRLYSHAGTHMDAPRHFVAHARPIDEVDLSKCVGEALVIDLSHKTARSFITVEDVAVWERSIGAGSRLLLRTDWCDHADREDYRTGHQRVSLELARWLAARQIALLGVEAPSVASLRPEDKAEGIAVHRTLLEAEIVIVESLANLRLLRQPTVVFVALPLPVTGGDGSPVRAVAIEACRLCRDEDAAGEDGAS